ncbi:MAG: M12 family metallo-peptidase [Phycisphaerales bacterium]
MSNSRRSFAPALLSSLIAACGVLFAAASPASAQRATAGSPPSFTPIRTAGAATVVFSDGAAIDAMGGLAPNATTVIERFPLPRGRTADLELERFTVTTPNTRFVVGTPGGPDRPLNFDPNRIVMLRGSVRGMPGSHVFLSFSPWGSSGTITTGAGERPIAVTSRSGGGVDLGEGELAVYEVPASGPAGAGSFGPPLTCGTDTSRAEPQMAAAKRMRPISPVLSVTGVTDGAPIKGLQQIEMAVETDFEFYSLYGNLQEAGAYVTQLYAQVSDIYIRDVNTRVDLVYVRLWDAPSGLYPTADPLAAFRDHWNTNMGSVARDVAQYCSGRRTLSAGGVAYLAGLCNNNSYSWIGYVAGFFADPTIPHVHNHDIMVAAHELGHNCNTPHTHDLGLDTCDQETSPPQRGTIMSYCGQTFTGGAANQDLRMHSVVELIMEAYITTRACVADDCNGNAIHDPLDIASGFSPDVNANGTPDECEDCNANGVLDPQDIALGTSPDTNGNGTPDECEPDCNGNNVPDDLDFVARIVNPVFADNFETNLGWTTEVLAATAGAWERGVPVNDPGYQYDPQSDSDGSGQCYLTGNVPGNSDVDAGAVRLTSPTIGMAAGGLSLSYDYYLNLTNTTGGVDRLLVEGNNAGGAGTWVVLATHTANNGTEWTRHVLTPAQFAAAGLAQTASMRFRFTANDANPQSIVESAIDAVVVGTYVPPVSTDLNFNNIPDDCEPDDDNNGALDYAQIQADMGLDLNRNALLDAFEDCDNDTTPDLVELGQAHNVWIASLDHTRAREYLALWGTLTRVSTDAGVTGAADLIITPDRRILVTSGLGNRVVEFAMSGALVGDLVAPGSGGLANPAGMAIKPGGTLLVASAGTNSVLEYNLATGAFVGVFVASGSGGLVAPYGLTFGPTGDLFVSSDDGRVLRYSDQTGAFAGEFVTLAGNGGLTNPRGLLFVPSTGRFLAASYGSDRVLEYNGATGAFIKQFNINGTATVMTLDQPTCLRIGPEGNVYVSRTHDHESTGGGGTGPLHLTNARIYEFRSDNGFLMRAYIQGVNSGLDHPTGFDFVPDAGTDCNNNQRADNCDIAGGFSPDMNSNGVPDECEELCYPDCNGSGTLTVADFGCFQGKYVLGDLYADCNTSGTLTVADFGCFQGKYVLGCP